MINSNEQEDRKAERKKQDEHARAVSAARKHDREEELRRLHLLATEVGLLMGGKARSAAAGNAWMIVDLSANHELSFYREGDQINIRGRVNGFSYVLNVSPRLALADIVKAINRKSAAKISESEIWSARVGKRNSLPAVAGG
jgi:hypothetical protein